MDVDWQSICYAGSRLDDEAGAALEARVAANADDVEARVGLVGFYRLGDEALAPRRGEHLLWLATHHPEIELGGFASLIDDLAPVEHAALLGVWRAQAANPDAGVAVLENAAQFIGFPHRNTEEVEALYRRAAALEPTNARWREHLGRLLTTRAEDASGEARSAIARDAIAEYDIASSLASRASTLLRIREGQLPPLVLAEDWERVVALAERVLVDNEADRESWNYGNVVHHANLALGWAARARGDLAGAGAFLLRASETPGSPQLNSFGPRFELAESLLRAGERAAVREYLEGVRRFWSCHDGDIARWLVAIDAGATTLERRHGED